MAALSISLLGGFAVLRAAAPVTAFGHDKVRALLAFLARGLELYAFVARHPYVANSCWHAGCFGRRIEALAAALSPAAAAAARARGLAGREETVVHEVLEELAVVVGVPVDAV